MTRRNKIAYSIFATAFLSLIGSFIFMFASLRPDPPKPEPTIEEREREMDQVVKQFNIDSKLLTALHKDFTKTFKHMHEGATPTPAESYMIRLQAFQLAFLFTNGHYPNKEPLYVLSTEGGIYSIGVPDDAEIDGRRIKIPREQFRLHGETFYTVQTWLRARGSKGIEDYPEWL